MDGSNGGKWVCWKERIDCRNGIASPVRSNGEDFRINLWSLKERLTDELDVTPLMRKSSQATELALQPLRPIWCRETFWKHVLLTAQIKWWYNWNPLLLCSLHSFHEYIARYLGYRSKPWKSAAARARVCVVANICLFSNCRIRPRPNSEMFGLLSPELHSSQYPRLHI